MATLAVSKNMRAQNLTLLYNGVLYTNKFKCGKYPNLAYK